MPDLICHRCSSALTPGEGSYWVVRIEAFADPTPPNLDDAAQESALNMAEEWQRLLASMKEMSERELMDQVHRRLTLTLCAACYRRWIERPTG